MRSWTSLEAIAPFRESPMQSWLRLRQGRLSARQGCGVKGGGEGATGLRAEPPPIRVQFRSSRVNSPSQTRSCIWRKRRHISGVMCPDRSIAALMLVSSSWVICPSLAACTMRASTVWQIECGALRVAVRIDNCSIFIGVSGGGASDNPGALVERRSPLACHDPTPRQLRRIDVIPGSKWIDCLTVVCRREQATSLKC